MWEQLQLVLPELRAVTLIPAPKMVGSRLGVMSMHGSGKVKQGVCKMYLTTTFVHCPRRMDMIALTSSSLPRNQRGTILLSPLSGTLPLLKWWDDLAVFPAHHEVPPLHHIPDISNPTLHRMHELSWYRGLANPPLHYPRTPFANRPLTRPPAYATPNPSLLPDCPAPPMPLNFVDGLAYTVNLEIPSSDDCKDVWERVEKFCGRGGGGIKFRSFSMLCLTKKAWTNKAPNLVCPSATSKT